MEGKEHGLPLFTHRRVESNRSKRGYCCCNAGWNDESNIIEEIKEIKFSYLSVICLEKNRIESLEKLGKIFLPAVREVALCIFLVDLVENSITEARALKKCHWPHLKMINFSKNKLKKTGTRSSNWILSPCFPSQKSMLSTSTSMLIRSNLQILECSPN